MKLAIVILVILLLGSNAFWIYQIIDQSITLSYRDQRVYELDATTRQLVDTLMDVGETVPRGEMIEIATRHTQVEAFDKDGCTWVGWIGFRFNASNELVYVSAQASAEEDDLCAPEL